jgi:hypothetical protein
MTENTHQPRPHETPDDTYDRFSLTPIGDGLDSYTYTTAREHADAAAKIDRRIAEDTGEVPAITSEVAQGIGGGALSGAEVYGPPAPGEVGSPVQASQPSAGELPPNFNQ